MTMIKTPEPLTETPPSPLIADKADLLSDVLSHVRLAGAMFLRGEYSAPWSLDSPDAADLVALLAPGAERLILFHIVNEGSVWVSAGGERVEAEAGDIIVLPHGHRHLMGSAEPAKPVTIAELLPPPPWEGVPYCRLDGGGQKTGIVCGYLRCEELLFNSFLRRLPPIFRVRPTPGPAKEWMQACVTYALDERMHSRQGGATLRARLPELLLMEALRLYCEQTPPDTGWLAAINDPVVGRALAFLHAEPARKWTVETLARAAATSRSVLDERFRNLLGQPPIHYLAEWRMQLAAGLLCATRLTLAAVAEQAGYGSEEAFSRAFRRYLGRSPGQWREVNGMQSAAF